VAEEMMSSEVRSRGLEEAAPEVQGDIDVAT